VGLDRRVRAWPRAPDANRGLGVYMQEVEYRALGPLEVVVEGRPLKLGGPRQRAVLAALLTHINQTVSQDALIDAVWGEDPPGSAKSTLHSYVYALRKELGGEQILRHGDGYRIDVEEGSFDVAVFEGMVRNGQQMLPTDPASASAILSGALALWYGRPYAGVDENATVASEVSRLEEVRLATVESRIEAELALGNDSMVVGELETLVREHPLRERFRAQQMLALYRTGRQAEALRAFQHARTYLAEELGIDPSAELSELEQRMLVHDPTLAPVPEASSEELAFLFTDVEGSTALLEIDSGTGQSAIDRQDAIITRSIEIHLGKVFKRIGDGLFAVFPDVAAAVEAASSAQVELLAEDWGDIGEVKVRMAVDEGEVHNRTNDYAGPVLHRLSRILPLGHGGQVLLSSRAQTSLGEEDRLRALGEYRLRGIGRPESIFQLLIADLPDQFPPLRVDRPPSSLQGVTEVRTVRGYELRDPLGSGDFGVVYRAFQPAVGREVAVKLVRPEYANQPVFVRRFEREAQIVAQLEHPHIVPLFDYWRDPEGAYLVMPYLRGGSLAAALHRGGWNLASAIQLLEQVAGALAYAHRRRVIHRDVKPGNILLDEEGNGYLTDFGIASRLTDELENPMSTSLAFVPPEEHRGETLTARSDVFSVGVLTFQLLTGVVPQGRPPLPNLSTVRPGLPAELDEVIARATDDNPANRFEKIEDMMRALRQAVGADVVAVADPAVPFVSTEPIRNPYKGLRAFRVTDAIDFFGRDALVDELLRAVASNNVVAVVGSSGSGKSSVVRAGLIPALRAGGIPRSRQWLVTDMFPGSYPFEELEAALLRVAVDRPSGLLTDLQESNGLLRATKQILPGDDDTLFLVIDQFEELFSAVGSEATRRRFLDNLVEVAADQRSRVRVVLTMRADFFNRPLDYGGFAEVMGKGMVTVGPPTRDGLAQAIAAPARAVGIDLEPGLVARVIADVENQPGGLPLLQYALTELFARRDGDTLTIEAYEQTGGVLGALGRRAEELHASLPDTAKEAARQLFLRLVTVDEGAADTRRRASQHELRRLDVDRETLELVMAKFGSSRLLSFDRDAVTRGPTVEVAHEALLNEWGRLREWIDERRQELALSHRIGASTTDWLDSSGDPSFLLTGARLQQAEEWMVGTDMALTAEEFEFIAASREQRRAAEARDIRRRRRTILALVLVALLLSILGAIAFIQRGVAQRETRQALARQLAGESTLALQEDPERAVLVAMDAVEATRSAGEPPLPESLAALQQAIQTTRVQRRWSAGGEELAVSPDGTWAVVDEAIGTSDAVVLDLEGDGRIALPGPGPLIEALAVSPDASLVAAGYDTRKSPESPEVVLFDPSTGSEVGRFEGPSGLYQSVDFSPNGRGIVAAADQITLWDVETEDAVASIQPGVRIGAALFNSDGSELIVSMTRPAGIGTFSSESGAQTGFFPVDVVGRPIMALDPARERVAVSTYNSARLMVYDLGTGEQIFDVPVAEAQSLSWTADARLLASSGNQGIITLVDSDTGAIVSRLPGSRAPVLGLGFTADGRSLVSTAFNGETTVWDMSADGLPAAGAIATHGGPEWGFQLSPDNMQLAAFTLPNGFELLEVEGGELLASIDDQAMGIENGIRLASPDFSLIGSVESNGRSTIRSLPSEEVLVELDICTGALAFSADNSLVLEHGPVCSDAVDPEDVPTADPTARVIEITTREVVLEVPHYVYSAQFNPPGALEGGRYVALTDQSSVEVYDVSVGERVGEMTLEDVGVSAHLNLSFDPQGRYLAAGTTDGRVWVVDLTQVVDGTKMSDAIEFNQVGHTGPAPWPSISASGVLATAGFDSLVKLWNIHTDEMLVEFRTDLSDQQAPATAFSSDGSFLLYPDTGNVIRRYYVDPKQLIAVAEEMVTRGYTPDECRRYRDPATCAADGN
jgi:DNA-binding SARP family transcriptional activator/WD40 repeat protein/tRNA A-37 threonylcarbamoyl transferase component Bud32